MTKHLPLIVLVAAVVFLPLVVPSYYLTLMNFIGLAAIIVLGLVLLTGIGGMTSFGQAAFAGIAAYTTAWFTTQAGLSPWLTLPLALVVTALAATLIGLLTLNLSGHYLPLSTLAWSLALFFLAGNMPALGGHDGIGNIPPLTIFGHAIAGKGYTWLIWATVGLSMLSVRNLLDSRLGRAIRALPRGQILLRSFGVGTSGLKLLVFVHAAVLAALSGWLFAHMMRFVSPTPFGINASIEYLFMAVIGGAASLWGAVLGAGAVVIAKDLLQDLVPGIAGSPGAAETIIFGLCVVLVLQYAPGGIMSRFVPRRRASQADQEALPRARPPAGQQIMQVTGLSRRFGGLVAVSDLNFELRAREILAVIGPNGAGKTTLFNLLSGVLPATEGNITLQGQDLTRMPQARIARLGMARTFQHVRLRPEMTVIENVALGVHRLGHKGALTAILRLDRAEEDRLFRIAQTQLARVGLSEFAEISAGDLPQGRQRIVEIARALASDPDVLLLDEPAAGLRFGEKQQLATLIRQLQADGLTVMIVEHDMTFLMNLADRVLVLNFGERIAEGAPKAVMVNPEVQRAYLGEDAA